MGRVKVDGKLGERARIRRDRGDRTRILPMIKEVALAEFGPDEDRDPRVIHPSEMAKADWCIRATYWRISGKPEPDRKFNFVLETIFSAGNDAHEKYQRWMRATGKLYGAWECLACHEWWTGISGELPETGCNSDWCLDVAHISSAFDHVWAYREVRMRQPGGLIAGRADGGIDDALVECKTIGLGTLRIESPKLLKKYYNESAKLYDLDRLWKELTRPFPSHVRQANVYLWLARELGLPFKQMNFVYEFKPNQQTKEFDIELSESILEPLLDKAVMIETAFAQGTPPPCESGGCKECQAYEGGTGGSPAERSQPRPDGKARRVVTGGRTRGGEAATGAAPASRRRTAAGPVRSDGARRPGADGAVRSAEPVGRVSRRSVGDGSGRRVVRRQAGGEARRVRADSGEE